MEIFILLFLIVINGFFAMSEIAVVSARRSRLEAAARNGKAGPRKAVELSEHPTRFLSTVQVGITVIGIFTGLYGGETLALRLEKHLLTIPFFAGYAHGISITVVVIIITYFSIVLGELFPKRIGLAMPEKIAGVVARPMYLISRIAAPFIWLLSRSTELLIRLFRIRKTLENQVTDEEIKAIVQEGADTGSIEEIEQDLVENVLHLGDRDIQSLMTHRNQIVWINAEKPFEEQIAKITGTSYSIFPVCNGSLDEVTGMFYVKDYARRLLNNADPLERSALREPLFLPESIQAYGALERFMENRSHIAVVVDEYGSIQGILTLNDLLRVLVGHNGRAANPDIVRREDGSFLIKGNTPMQDLFHAVNEPTASAAGDADYNTVAGFVIDQSGRIPATGEKFPWLQYWLEVVDMDGPKIDRILVSKKEVE